MAPSICRSSRGGRPPRRGGLGAGSKGAGRSQTSSLNSHGFVRAICLRSWFPVLAPLLYSRILPMFPNKPLARNSAYVQIVLDELERLGIALQFATEELENTPLGRAIMNMRAYAGEVETERRRDRFHRAKMARVQSGKPLAGSRSTYCYDWSDGLRADGKLAPSHLREH